MPTCKHCGLWIKADCEHEHIPQDEEEMTVCILFLLEKYKAEIADDGFNKVCAINSDILDFADELKKLIDKMLRFLRVFAFKYRNSGLEVDLLKDCHNLLDWTTIKEKIKKDKVITGDLNSFVKAFSCNSVIFFCCCVFF